MVIISEQALCNNASCDVRRTGACAEGHAPLESCPFYGQLSEADNDFDGAGDAPASQTDKEHDKNHVKLPSGEALEVAEVDQILKQKPIKLISIVGDSGTGKTTLIKAIYDQFLRGRFAGYHFAGSRTLIGFERKIHPSRVDSGRVKPDTTHTSLAEGLGFFHFALVVDGQQDRIELMLSDRAGEVYRNARDKIDTVSELIEVVKADMLVLLVDGKRLVNRMERQNAIAAVRGSLRAFLDGKALNGNSRVQIVTTMMDYIDAYPAKAELNQHLDNFKQELQKLFTSRLAELSFYEVAALDSSCLKGVDELFLSWFVKSPEIVQRQERYAELPLTSEFDFLLVRTHWDNLP